MKTPSALVLVLTAVAITVSCGGTPADSSPSSTSPAFDARATTSTITGTITALTGTCPTVTFALERRIIKTDAGTSFGDVPCLALKNAIRVEVTGTSLGDGSVLATRVRLVPATNAPSPPPAPAPTLVSVVGLVDGFVGACPSVTFTIERRLFKTNASTVFAGDGCTALANGVRVELAGTVQPDGSINVVKLAPAPRPSSPPASPPAPPTTGVLAGAIVELAGACPVVRINVGGRTASTTASTIFDGKPCAELKVGTFVEIAFAAPATNAAIVALKVAARR